MSESTAGGSRDRLVEIGLWVLVLAAAALVMLPALVQWVEARQAETEMTQQRRDAQQDLSQLDRQLQWLVSDPQTDEKLQERYAIQARKGQD